MDGTYTIRVKIFTDPYCQTTTCTQSFLGHKQPCVHTDTKKNITTSAHLSRWSKYAQKISECDLFFIKMVYSIFDGISFMCICPI